MILYQLLLFLCEAGIIVKVLINIIGRKRMSVLEIFLIGIGLSMDAFAVSICKGLAMKKAGIRQMLIVGAWFGGFQALMPLLGYLLGSTFARYITKIDHWVAFILLTLIGLNMIRESRSKEEKEDASLRPLEMLLLAIATSIDALAVGITFSFTDIQIIPAVLLIGATTFALSAAGVKVGNVFWMRYHSISQVAGGVILILIGTRILLRDLGVI